MPVSVPVVAVPVLVLSVPLIAFTEEGTVELTTSLAGVGIWVVLTTTCMLLVAAAGAGAQTGCAGYDAEISLAAGGWEFD